MKRCLVILMMLFTLVLTFSCCGKTQTQYTQGSFQSSVCVNANEVQYKGILVYSAESGLKITISEPEILSGTVIESDEKGKTVACEGVSVKLPEDSPFSLLCDVTADFSKTVHYIGSKGEEKFSGEIKGTAYDVIFDCESKKINEIHSENLSCIFT